MTPRDRLLWLHDCRWRVRLANAEHARDVEALSTAAAALGAAREAEEHSRETLALVSAQLVEAEAPRRRGKERK